MQLPNEIDWNNKPLALQCPYSSCGICLHVGNEADFDGGCPTCKSVKGGRACWPNPRWLSANDDLVFLYNNARPELATIVGASYFEGCLRSFLWHAMYFVWDDTRWRPRGVKGFDPEEIRLNQACYEKIHHILQDRKYRGWRKRANKLCPRVLGEPFDDLVRKHIDNCDDFFVNRDNIHEWRNELLHSGHPMTETWPDDLKTRCLRATVEFMRQCWEVFRVLQNEYIARPMAERQGAAQPHC